MVELEVQEVQESRSSMNFGWKYLDDYEELGGGEGKGKGERGRDGIHLDLDK